MDVVGGRGMSGGKASRLKGHRFERELAAMFREAMPDAGARRGLAQSRSARETADVEVPCFWVEAKRQARPNVVAALRQAEAAATPGRMPVAVCKADREDATVTMRLDDWLELVSEWWQRREQ